MSEARSIRGVSFVTPYREIVPDLVRRLLLVLALILFVAGVLWADRGGLRDNAHPGRPLGFVDVFYFTIVTLTTVGYGDIVPVSERARLIGTLVVTPVRVFIFILFIGTAYELVLRRYLEAYQMRRVRERLHDHVIVCGYGVKGHATVAELLSYGRSPQQIAVIDSRPEAMEDAARAGLVAFRGDATAEATLRAAAIEKAAHVIVDVDRDDTTVLVCLTAKHLNPGVHLVAAAKEAENVPLVYRSGADVVVAGPVAGGRLLAIATVHTYAPRLLDDMLTFGRGLDFGEYRVGPDEAGKVAGDLPTMAGKLAVAAYHRGEAFTYARLGSLRLEEGDVIIYLVARS